MRPDSLPIEFLVKVATANPEWLDLKSPGSEYPAIRALIKD
jgi:hypothetical protein